MSLWNTVFLMKTVPLMKTVSLMKTVPLMTGFFPGAGFFSPVAAPAGMFFRRSRSAKSFVCGGGE